MKIKSVIMLLAFPVFALAQTQEGYVKTIGKPGSPGVGLDGVVISLKGSTNSTITKDKGRFSFPIKGESFSFRSVRLSGYELADKGVVNRVFGFTPSQPVEFSMVKTSELSANRDAIRENMLNKKQIEWDAKNAELEKLYNQGKIKLEEYDKRYEELQERMLREDSLISYLADVYARTDYDKIDSLTVQINECIQNGELDKAVALIHSKGDIGQRMAKINQRRELMQQLDKADVRQTEELVADLQNLATISKSQGKDKEAAQYIEQRADIAPNVIAYQIDAAEYMTSRCDEFYERALELAKALHTEPDFIYVSMGMTEIRRGNIDKATSYLEQAVACTQDDVLKAQAYRHIADNYRKKKDVASAEKYYRKANLDLDDINVAEARFQLARIVKRNGKVKDAEKLYVSAYAVFKKLNEGNTSVAVLDRMIDVSGEVASVQKECKHYKEAVKTYADCRGYHLAKLSRSENVYTNKQYAYVLREYGDALVMVGDYAAAEQVFAGAALRINQYENVNGDDYIEFVKNLYKSYAIMYSLKGDKTRAKMIDKAYDKVTQ